jgi:hypothetical protein
MTSEQENYEFIDRFDTIICKSGESKKDFAKKCGLAEKQIYDYLKGASVPGTKVYRKIKKRYPWVNLDWLISGHGSPTINQKEDNNIVPMDPAIGLVIEVENELSIKLNENQRQAVVAVLRRELDRRLSEQKTDIANLISSFAKGDSSDR